MNKYQLLFIIENGATDEIKESLVEKFTGLVGQLGGNVVGVEKWGARKYAYAINYKTEGYYVYVSFELAAKDIAELDRQLKINESIVRHLITKVV